MLVSSKHRIVSLWEVPAASVATIAGDAERAEDVGRAAETACSLGYPGIVVGTVGGRRSPAGPIIAKGLDDFLAALPRSSASVLSPGTARARPPLTSSSGLWLMSWASATFASMRCGPVSPGLTERRITSTRPDTWTRSCPTSRWAVPVSRTTFPMPSFWPTRRRAGLPARVSPSTAATSSEARPSSNPSAPSLSKHCRGGGAMAGGDPGEG